MARVRFTANLARHVPAGDLVATGTTVREVFDAIFAQRPQMRSYLLDDQGGLRHHVCCFVAGTQITDRRHLSDAVGPDDTVDVIQALSGG